MPLYAVVKVAGGGILHMACSYAHTDEPAQSTGSTPTAGRATVDGATQNSYKKLKQGKGPAGVPSPWLLRCIFAKFVADAKMTYYNCLKFMMKWSSVLTSVRTKEQTAGKIMKKLLDGKLSTQKKKSGRLAFCDNFIFYSADF